MNVCQEMAPRNIEEPKIVHLLIPFWSLDNDSVVISPYISDRLSFISAKGYEYKIHLLNIQITKLMSFIFRLLRININTSTSQNLNGKITANSTYSFQYIYGLKDLLFPGILVNNSIKRIILSNLFKNDDLIHLHITGVFHFTIAGTLNKLGCRYVATTNGMEIAQILEVKNIKGAYTENSRHLYNWIYSMLVKPKVSVHKKLLEKIPYLVFISRGQLNAALRKGYLGDNARIINNGVNPALFYPMEKKIALGRTNWKQTKKYVVGFVGMLYPVKRADMFPKIFSHINNQINDVEFILVGDGELKNELKEEFDGCGITATFTDTVAHDCVVNWMNLFDVLILPSRAEGFGNVIIEAQTCGIPAVGSDVGGIPDAIGSAGLVVAEGSDFEERFAMAVCDVLTGKVVFSKETITSNASARTVENMVNEEIQIYQNLISLS